MSRLIDDSSRKPYDPTVLGDHQTSSETPTLLDDGGDRTMTEAPPRAPTSARQSNGGVPLSRPIDDLTNEPLLSRLERRDFGGVLVPYLSGIALLSRLGQGGMGAVYHGWHTRLHREVAIKVLPEALALEAGMIERFEREARVASQASSPHLVGILDCDQTDGLHWMVLEYVHGVSARGYMDEVAAGGREGLDVAEALRIVVAATRGLAVLHDNGIVHRDVKPDNIFLVKNTAGQVDFDRSKLGDLGIARCEGVGQTLTQTNSGMGTPGYMAPEQVMDARHASAAADVFGMGATLYALLRGGAPFSGETTMDTLVATLKKNAVPLRTLRDDIPLELANLVTRCLEKEPNRRPQSGAFLLAELEALSIGDATSVSPRAPTPRAAQKVSSRAEFSGKRSTTPKAAAPAFERTAVVSAKSSGSNVVASARASEDPMDLAVLGGWALSALIGWVFIRQIIDGGYIGFIHEMLGGIHSAFHASPESCGADNPRVTKALVAPMAFLIGAIVVSIRHRTQIGLAAALLGLSCWLHWNGFYMSTAEKPVNLLLFESAGACTHDWRYLFQQWRTMREAKTIAGVTSFSAHVVGLAALAAALPIVPRFLKK